MRAKIIKALAPIISEQKGGYWGRVFDNINLVGGMENWTMDYVYYAPGSICDLCGHEPISYCFVIRNKDNPNQTMTIGSECIVNITNYRDKNIAKRELTLLKEQVWWEAQPDKDTIFNIVERCADELPSYDSQYFKGLLNFYNENGFIRKSSVKWIKENITDVDSYIGEKVDKHNRWMDANAGKLPIDDVSKMIEELESTNVDDDWLNKFLTSISVKLREDGYITKRQEAVLVDKYNYYIVGGGQ